MWNEGSTELQVTKGYWTAIGAKLLPIVDENFCSISHDGANCKNQFVCLIFGASAAQCEPAKRAIRRGVPAASPMIKSTIWRGRRRRLR